MQRGIWVPTQHFPWVPVGRLTPRRAGRLTVGRNVPFTLMTAQPRVEAG
jgi:hypothetical protein